MYGYKKREKKMDGGGNMQKQLGNAAARREKAMDGGMQKAARTKANMGRMMYNKGGQPEYKSGDMPKAKPC